jgi:Ca2+-binding RTX toxin-like protein
MNQVIGTEGDDYLEADPEVGSEVYGLGGNDILIGGSGQDVLLGGEGDDYLFGKGGDYLHGEGGNDTFVFYEKSDWYGGRIDGGAGLDTILLATSTGAFFAVTDEMNVEAVLIKGMAQVDARDVKHFISITADNNGSYLVGGTGGAMLTGGAGSDYLEGQVGANTFDGGDGDDFIVAPGEGNVINGGKGVDFMVVSGTRDNHIDGGEGYDYLHAVANPGQDVYLVLTDDMHVEKLSSSDGHGNDYFDASAMTRGINMSGNNFSNAYYIGGSGNDFLLGAMGDTTFFGGAGDDILIGSGGDNVLDGGAGNDNLFGSEGQAPIDYITGGAGADTFHILGKEGEHYIRDFNAAEQDKIHLKSITGDSEKDFYAMMEHAVQDGANIIITIVGVKVILEQIELSTLSSEYFMFG